MKRSRMTSDHGILANYAISESTYAKRSKKIVYVKNPMVLIFILGVFFAIFDKFQFSRFTR